MSRREDFRSALVPLQDGNTPTLHRDIPQLFPTEEAFRRWEDSLWLGLFFARRLTGELAQRPRVTPESAAGRIQPVFLELAKNDHGFFSPHSLIHDLPIAVRQTCCVRIDETSLGSGFLIGPGLVLTNWHVVRSVLTEPRRVSVAFDYLHEAGVGTPPQPIGASAIVRWRPAHVRFLATAPPSPTPLDYAVIALASSVPGERGHVDLRAIPALELEARVVVVGHPRGKPLAVSFSRSEGLHGFDGALAYYDADTLKGSSGSLVLVESEKQLKAALLHAGGLAIDKNFGIHLRAIHGDFKEPVTAPVAAAAPDTELENYFDRDTETRAGQLATLLSVLPPDIDIDVNAPVADQIERLAAQWNASYAEALAIARTVAAPAPPQRRAEAISPGPKQVTAPVGDQTPTAQTPTAQTPTAQTSNTQATATQTEVADRSTAKSTAQKGIELALLVLVVGAAALLLVPRIIARWRKAEAMTCGLTESSYLAPQRDELTCKSPMIESSARVECKVVTTQRGAIHGQCEGREPVGLWTSTDPSGKQIWSANFDTGEWHIPFTFNSIPSMATETRAPDLTVLSRGIALPSGAHVWQVPPKKLTRIRCGLGSSELRENGDKPEFSLEYGASKFSVGKTTVTFTTTCDPIGDCLSKAQIDRSLVDVEELLLRFMQGQSALAQCQQIEVTEPPCRNGHWTAGCVVEEPAPKHCYRHADRAKTLDEKECGTGKVAERAARPATVGDDAQAVKAGCGLLTLCTAGKRAVATATTESTLCNNLIVTKHERAGGVEFRYSCPEKKCSGTLRYEKAGTKKTEAEILAQYWDSRGTCE